MTKVLIMDQLYGPSPYALHEKPITFEALCDWAMKQVQSSVYATKPRIEEVDEKTFRPGWCQMVYRARPENGMAELWRYYLDSSD